MSEPYRAPPKLFGDPFVSVAGACGYADGVGHLGDHLTHVLRRVEARRKEAAKKWLWDVRERAVLVRDGGGRRLRFPAGWTEEDREARKRGKATTCPPRSARPARAPATERGGARLQRRAV